MINKEMNKKIVKHKDKKYVEKSIEILFEIRRKIDEYTFLFIK